MVSLADGRGTTLALTCATGSVLDLTSTVRSGALRVLT
jgi:hypothetical protein